MMSMGEAAWETETAWGGRETAWAEGWNRIKCDL